MATPDFKSLFEAAPGLFLVLDPTLRIVAATDAYLQATMTQRDAVLGKHIFEVFPDNPGDPTADGVSKLEASLNRVRRDLVPDTMAVQKYDIARPPEQGGGFEVRYWSPHNAPVFGSEGELAYIIHRVEDVTAFVELQQQRRQQHELTSELRQRTEKMEAEILHRSQELAETNDALRAANQVKTEFLSRASHELRTPLTAILGFADLLGRADLSPEHAEWLGVVRTSGRHLLSLVEELLDISRIESGQQDVALEPMPVTPALIEAVTLVRSLAQTHGVRLEPPPETDPHLRVRADRQRLAQVLVNLLSNAVKYNHPEGSVSVDVQHRPGDRLRISVTDTGRGIAPEQLEKLFVPFERLDAAELGIAGTGLGLAMSRRLVESMHGTLGVRSTPGAGSTFWVDLPVTHEPAVDPDEPVEDDMAPRMYPVRRRVLYVEDTEDNVALVRQVLALRPAVTLATATSGAEGLRLARAEPPDLILLDQHLHDLRGEEVIERLRMDPVTREVPIVAFSADATQSQISRARAAGAEDYLAKPVQVSTLLHTLDELLGGEDGPHAVRTRGRSTSLPTAVREVHPDDG